MRRMTALIPITLAALVAIGAAPANAASTEVTASPSGLANCTYRVVRDVNVYELPTTSSTYLKTKHQGERVRGFSRLTFYNQSERVFYRAVDIKKAQDDIGWLDATALRLIRCDRSPMS